MVNSISQSFTSCFSMLQFQPKEYKKKKKKLKTRFDYLMPVVTVEIQGHTNVTAEN